MAAQNQCTDAFQSLMNHMDQPFEGIFKIMDLTIDHTQILTVSFGKSYSYFMETSLIWKDMFAICKLAYLIEGLCTISHTLRDLYM